MPHEMLAVTAALDRRWYVVQTEPSRDYVAKRELEKRGFEPFLAECIEVTQHGRADRVNRRPAISRTKMPFFPGYLFVRFDANRDDWGVIDAGDIFGVSRLLRLDDRPIPVDEGYIVQLRADASTGLYIINGRVHIGEPALRAHRKRNRQKVRISAGNLYLAGRVDRLQQFLDMAGLRSQKGEIEALAIG